MTEAASRASSTINNAGHAAAVEFRGERAAALLQEYVEALHAAQASHEAFDWIRAGSIFKRYAAAAVVAHTDREG